MKTNRIQQPNEYEHYMVKEPAPLLEWLLANARESRSKIKATLKGKGVKVNGKVVSRFDYQLTEGDKITISKHKRNDTLDRKSTRLNSSHANISYAVFCLKKKNKKLLHKNTSL